MDAYYFCITKIIILHDILQTDNFQMDHQEIMNEREGTKVDMRLINMALKKDLIVTLTFM